MNQFRKLSLTGVIIAFVVSLGAAYQYYYLEERVEYERAIAIYYKKHTGNDLDPDKLRHFTTLALDRYGPTEIYRKDSDYERLLDEVLHEA